MMLMLAAVACFAVPSHAQQASGATAALLANAVPLPAILVPGAVAESAIATEARPLSIGAHAARGAVAGAVIGLSLIALSPECWAPDSTCGIAILPMAAAGAAVGGAVGLVVGLVRNP